MILLIFKIIQATLKLNLSYLSKKTLLWLKLLKPLLNNFSLFQEDHIIKFLSMALYFQQKTKEILQVK